MASLQLFGSLPMDLIGKILTFNINFVIRRGEIITINKIPKNDKRYSVLLTKPTINTNNMFNYPYHSKAYVCLPQHNGDMAPHYLISGKDRLGEFILFRIRGKKLYPEHKPYTYKYYYLE
jgi:hypothetical protein